MKQIINSSSEPNWPNIEVDFDRPIELFVDNFKGYNPNTNSFKILWVKEAEEISHFKSHAIANHKQFDAVITYDEDILKQCDNSFFLEFGTAWVHDFDFKTVKKFQVSHLAGFKEITEGHLLRKKVHYKQNRITLAKDFYISQHGGVENSFNNKFLGESKNPLFESQYHLCIENSRQKNFFTEKLIDCLITKTIPIYWGCDNIENFFDTNGFFIVNSFEEIINICNSLTEETYESKKEYIEKNFELAKKYVTILDRFERVVYTILNKENVEKLISIVIPTYEANGKAIHLLEDLLNSIYKQTYKNIEIIISDHSKDNNINEYLFYWKDRLNITYAKNYKSPGNSSVNMNEGIKKASGDFIKIMHMDDRFCDNKAISKLVEAISKDSSIKWGAFGFNHFYTKEDTIRRDIVPASIFNESLNNSALIGCPSVSFFVNDGTNFFDENLIIVNDFDMHFSLEKKYGKPFIIPEISITIRIHESQVTSLLPSYREKELGEINYFKNKIQ